MKKIFKSVISLILVSVLIFPFSLISFGKEEDYSELIKAKYEYYISNVKNITPEYEEIFGKSVNQELVENSNVNYHYPELGLFPYFYYTPVMSKAVLSLTVLLYTESAKDLDFKIFRYVDGEIINQDGQLHSPAPVYHLLTNVLFKHDQEFRSTGFTVQCPEITEVLSDWSGSLVYTLHEAIKYLGITKEELKKANELAQREPEYIRVVLPDLTDEDYESLLNINGTINYYPLDDYVIEALFVEDDYVARNLLIPPSCVYVPEIDGIITRPGDIDRRISEEKWTEVDYTSDFWGVYLAFVRNFNALGDFSDDEKMWQKFMDLRTKQLAEAPETGEELIFIPMAIVSLSLGIYVVKSKKFKRIKI